MTMDQLNGSSLGFENKLWEMADKLRGHMDAAEYKHVVLGLIFLNQAKYEGHKDRQGTEYADPEAFHDAAQSLANQALQKNDGAYELYNRLISGKTGAFQEVQAA